MSHHETHCPFLNRSDYRCANHFSLDKLDRAFTHCFGEYQTCPTYREMLTERQSRQPSQEHQVAGSASLTGGVVYANLTVRQRPANVTVNPVRLPAQHATASAA